MKVIRVTKYKSPQIKGYYYQEGNRLIRWYHYNRLDRALKLVSEKINNKTQIVGDFGCGLGVFIPTLAKYFQSVVALTYDEYSSEIELGVGHWNMLNIIRELVNTELGDVRNIHYINCCIHLSC